MTAGGPASYEIAAATLGLLTATHADSHRAGPRTLDYLAGLPTDRSPILSLVAGMTALATMLIELRVEETGVVGEGTPLARVVQFNCTRHRGTGHGGLAETT